MKHYDLIILGSGMVGSSLAASLADSGKKIAIIDRFPLDHKLIEVDDDFELRVSAISRASEQYLKSVGAWPLIQQQRCFPYEHMRVWDSEGEGHIEFDAEQMHVSVLGHIIENKVINNALNYILRSQENIDVIAPCHVSELQQDDLQCTLKTDQGDFSAPLLLGADGTRSWLRQQLQISSTRWPYQQSAVVCHVTLSGDHQATAWQRFHPSGPLAFLPLSQKRCSIVWSNRSDIAEEKMALNDESFQQELNQAIGETALGKVTSVSKRAMFPLQFQHADSYISHRCALFGDAAHTIHPLAGQGVNLGFMDSATLGEEILNAWKKRKDIGNKQLLRRYERRRKGDNLAMMGGVDIIKKLFSNDDDTLIKLRNFGINLTNKVTPAKHMLMRRALGFQNNLPSKLRMPDYI